MSECLVVVDMQPGFLSSVPVIKEVAREIRRAKRLGSHIMIVEYEFYQRTHECLLSLIEGYENQSFVMKNRDGGGPHINSMMNRCKLPDFENFRLCGVNFGACVRRTAEGLSERFLFSKVEVIKKASNPGRFGSDDDGRLYHNTFDNIEVKNRR